MKTVKFHPDLAQLIIDGKKDHEVVEKPLKDLDDADWEGHERFPSEEAMYAWILSRARGGAGDGGEDFAFYHPAEDEIHR